jgi:hypothetical protein
MSYHYYEVLDSSGNRICMCATEADARMMMSLGHNRSWVKCQFLKPDTVETTAERIEELTLNGQKILQANEALPLEL